MTLLSLDQGKCVKCNICAEVCPIGIVEIGDDGVETKNPQLCTGCGHCVAVCPTAALDNWRNPLAGQVPIEGGTDWDAETAKRFLRSRRSIRCYRPEAVPREKLLQLLDIARFAPSGGNSQGLSYLVISDREKLKKITEVTIDWMRQMAENGPSGDGQGSIYQKYGRDFISRYRESGKDIILREAPHLIVAQSPDALGMMGRGSARFALEYVELYAPALGLGTCWAGLVEGCAAAGYVPLLEIMELPADRMVAGLMMVGYPQYVYHRLVDRNPLAVSWA